jgi:hypothetical protein
MGKDAPEASDRRCPEGKSEGRGRRGKDAPEASDRRCPPERR